LTDLDAQIDRFHGLFMEGVIEGVALVAADANACAACLTVTDRVYQPRQLPRIPLADCTRTGGCRCRYEPGFMVIE
jgi:hypothetical protein